MWLLESLGVELKSGVVCGTAVCKPCWIILLSFVERVVAVDTTVGP
jgi:hypothetical protein